MATNPKHKDLQGKNKVAKKYWKIESKEGSLLEFFPVFETDEDGNVEAKFIQLRFKDEKGNYKQMTFNYLDIYMFMYFTANEELRQNLLARHERMTNYIPYDVQLELSEEERKSGIARRRVELPLDEVVMAIARNEAWKLWIRSNHKENPRAFTYKKKRRR